VASVKAFQIPISSITIPAARDSALEAFIQHGGDTRRAALPDLPPKVARKSRSEHV